MNSIAHADIDGLKRAVEAYVAKARGTNVSFSMQENLFAAGLLSSLHIPGLVAVIERFVGKEIPLEESPLEAFYTVQGMYDAFVEGRRG